MKRVRTTFVLGTALAVVMAGTAYALTVNPTGGAPGSHYQVEVPCSVEPEVKVRDLGYNQATLPPRDGVESSPGTWTYDIEANDVDQMVFASCGDQLDKFRYNVDNPKLFPGPTSEYYSFINPFYGDGYTSVVGTDCPAGTTASVTIKAAGGYTYSGAADIDTYGNWELPIPTATPKGDITVDASCGSVHFAALAMRFGGDTAPTASPAPTKPAGPAETTPTTTRNATGSNPAAASAVAATPRYTG